VGELKRNPRRTVELLPADSASARARVVKRYHHPGRVERLFDRARASEELRLLRELEARGVPVPRPIEARRTAEGFELVTEWIEGAVPLDAVLRGTTPAPAPAAEIARNAARALAAAHVAGLAHRDLHPGNLVAQPGGRAWIVDVRGARLGRGFAAPAARRDLVALASSVFERVPASLRARFLVAYLRALPPAFRAGLPELAELARDVESAARAHRREAVRRAAKRWTRLSSACRPFARGGMEGFASVEVEDVALDDFRGDGFLVLRGRPWREILRAWYAAARLADHAIPAARPWVLGRSPERFAAFALPPGAAAGDPIASPAERAAIESALLDRRLSIEGSRTESVRVDASGRAWILPLADSRLVDFDAEDPSP
jgi:tRNA A-37 threonylcarbamoyl transferase component Bud32